MGCGSSSLKGDDVPNVNSQPVNIQAGQPIKKVNTNFSDINYDQGHQHRRMTEYAPHETPAPIREQSHDLSAEAQKQRSQSGGLAPDQPGSAVGAPTSYPHDGVGPTANAIDGEPDTKLKPYQTIDGDNWDNENNAATDQNPQPYVNGTQDPTSNRAKDDFAAANDPANPLNQESHHAHHAVTMGGSNNEDDAAFYTPNPDVNDPDHPEHKKSWLGEKYSSFQAAKRGTGPSDEDVLKYTGKDKNELNEWSKDTPGVGGNQGAGRVGTDSGLAAGASWN
ncbi:hypothetical protein H2200_002309 [Cladophialophora chaetospira]|uniref:Uncharacterized protein n=1 Tax=Cladophialophora chaetospira TaxID=386627 RepID=A0AA38XIU9_9EURO|nr:hypothetical protein H2200_002309 [Cladophialophora chaetospira]